MVLEIQFLFSFRVQVLLLSKGILKNTLDIVIEKASLGFMFKSLILISFINGLEFKNTRIVEGSQFFLAPISFFKVDKVPSSGIVTLKLVLMYLMVIFINVI